MEVTASRRPQATAVRVVLSALLTGAGLLAGSAPAVADDVGPVGDPFVVSISPAVQSGVLGGAVMTPAGLVCTVVTAGECVVTQAVAVLALPVVVAKGECPGKGVRKVLMQGYRSVGNYGWPSTPVPVYYSEVRRDWCAPA